MQVKPFHGEGPGPQTKDGCSVELYRQLPYRGEIEFLSHHLSPGDSILELGCGSGRLTRRFLSFGCAVTAVDNSAEMLSHVPLDAHLIHSDIEHLDLRQKFDVVILPSCLINHADPEVRAAFVAAAFAHTKPAGRFIFERHDPLWLSSASVGLASEMQGISVWIESVDHIGEVIEMTVRYADARNSWKHSFSVVSLDDASLQHLLQPAGFGQITWLEKARCWACVSRQNIV